MTETLTVMTGPSEATWKFRDGRWVILIGGQPVLGLGPDEAQRFARTVLALPDAPEFSSAPEPSGDPGDSNPQDISSAPEPSGDNWGGGQTTASAAAVAATRAHEPGEAAE